MSKVLLIVLNKEIALGKVLNALSHLAFGLGHRVPRGKMPNLNIYFSDTDGIYRFRQISYLLWLENPNSSIFSDFTNTMNEGTAEGDLKKTLETPENQLEYFGVCICSDLNELTPITELLDTDAYFKTNSCNMQVNDSSVEESLNDFIFNEAVSFMESSIGTEYKISVILNEKIGFGQLLTALVSVCLEVGMQIEYEKSGLITFLDKDGSKHPNLSLHPLPVLIPKNNKKFWELFDSCANDSELKKSVYCNQDNTLSAICIFGEQRKVNVVTRKSCSLWKKSLSDICTEKNKENNDFLTKDSPPVGTGYFL